MLDIRFWGEYMGGVPGLVVIRDNGDERSQVYSQSASPSTAVCTVYSISLITIDPIKLTTKIHLRVLIRSWNCISMRIAVTASLDSIRHLSSLDVIWMIEPFKWLQLLIAFAVTAVTGE